ncbi:MAG: hypothetical protein LBK26_01620 [Rickettsiales bacterium]|jgi:hypothetical protein|nr:hypothetical protein [Rickettsiales bacterium]
MIKLSEEIHIMEMRMFNVFKKINVFALSSLLVALCAQSAQTASPIQTSGLVTNTSLTGRPALAPAYSVAGVNTIGGRMPTLRTTSGTGISTTTTGAVSVTDKECIDSYLECAKQPDVCGPNFEDCTNNSLFFAKKSNCTSILLTCPANGISQLFGTTSTSVLATKSTTDKDENGEYVYIYPNENSILGTMIVGASITQRLNTQDCVRKYTQCLKKDDVCGADFELCTSDTEFRKQKVFCQSTLARCQLEGKVDLWGTTNVTANPQNPGRLRDMIDEGAALAAVNAVATCYKVADNCILQACAKNPYLCKEGTDPKLYCTAGEVVDPDDVARGCSDLSGIAFTGAINRNEILGRVKNACFDTIGGNKYCYSTVRGNMPTAAQLKDEDNKDDVFSDMYSSRFNTGMKTKVDDLIEKFKTKQMQKCRDAIVGCAMRSCGEGVGSVCYAGAYNTTTKTIDVTQVKPKGEIQAGCATIINSDASCKYATATFDDATAVLGYEESGGIFGKLFTSPTDEDGSRDPVGAVAALNARLANSYSTAALAAMQKQCQGIAQSCVKSMCGGEYENCYRNRTDVYSALTNTSKTAFDKSMNKVGGVLDHTIIIGLCINTVKNNPICEEHIKVESAKIANGTITTDSVWGDATSAREGWLGAGVFSITSENSVQDTDADGNLLCCAALADSTACTSFGRCDDAGGLFVTPKMIEIGDYQVQKVTEGIFANLIYDLEVEAQAKYNAKITAQMNMCHAENSGGVMGASDMNSTFQWAKLKSKNVPADYSVKGLPDSAVQASNDLYGSFCRVRVEIRSNDAMIKKAIEENGKTWTRTNFAIGDAFTCGSWIPQKDLEEISQLVYNNKYEAETKNDGRTRGWMTALGSVLGAVGGGVGVNALQKSSFGGLINTNKQGGAEALRAESCKNKFQNAIKSLTGQNYATQSEMVNGADGTFVGWTYKAYSLTPAQTAGLAAAQDQAAYLSALNVVTASSAISTMTTYAESEQCGKFNGGNGNSLWTDGRGKTLATIGGAVIGAVGGGFLANAITKDVQESSAEKAANEAKTEWFNSIGSKILCYIGSEEVGVYGDIRSTSME